MTVTLTVDADATAHIILARPAKRNALDRAMLLDLRRCIASLQERDDVHVVLLRGEAGVFCAGADIADWTSPTNRVAEELSRLGKETFDALADLPAVSVAVIEGVAVGGGLELALACDFRIADVNARLGLPELGLGNLPSWGGMARLVDVAGLGVARQLLLSSMLITGAQAAELRVVTAAHPADEIQDAVAALVAQLGATEPHATSLAKQVLRELQTEIGIESALAGYTAGLDSSRLRKQEFLDKKAAAKAARNTTSQGVTA